MQRLDASFVALLLVQAIHSVEEYFGKLWESFPPARAVSSLVSQGLERGFLILNLALVAFGVWWRAQRRLASSQDRGEKTR